MCDAQCVVSVVFYTLMQANCHFVVVFFFQRRTRERLMNVLSLCGPESGIPKNPSVRLLSYSKASDKVSVNSQLKNLNFSLLGVDLF